MMASRSISLLAIDYNDIDHTKVRHPNDHFLDIFRWNVIKGDQSTVDGYYKIRVS